ncbi:hypothetical protein ECE50_004285 [Chitinophaga sp. Mgbs1]|uniref:Uncharacterized protein n=1 Tax=Chitinophaga solisilvae TaxID=1233460 RepID=A0A3S1D2E3_9BACT|nr:hypothetical protein [Chitinophaga solisilvae]
MHLPFSNTDTGTLSISYLIVTQNQVPATEFEAGTALTLSWQSTGTYFRLYAANNPQPVYEGEDTSTTLSSGVTVDTTFTLEASSGGDKLYSSVTITISNPALTPGSVTVAKDDTVNNNLNAEGDATFNQLKVTGTLVFPNQNDPSLEITGDLFTNCQMSVTGTTTVQGTATIDSLTVNGSLQVNGNFNNSNGVQVPQLNASGLTAGTTSTQTLEAGKSLTALAGSVSLFTNSQTLYQGKESFTKSFKAKTDGYFLVYLQADDTAFSTLEIQIDSYTINATGGSTYLDKKNAATIFLPVAKGKSLTYTVVYKGFYTIPTEFTIKWFPIGQAADKKETYEITDMPGDRVEEILVEVEALLTARYTARQKAASSFIQHIEQTCNKTIDAPAKQLLIEKLLTMK